MILFMLSLTVLYCLKENKQKKSENPVELVIYQKDDIKSIIDEINEKNNKIKTVKVSKFQINSKIKLTGQIFYEKEKLFKMTVNSFLGKELEVGSDNNYFWYTIKKNLYFAKHSDLEKTRLKNSFNPIWLVNCLAVQPIHYDSILKMKDKIGAIEEIKGTCGEKNTKLVLINPQEKRIEGYYLYNKNDKMIASYEITSFKNGFPYKVFTTLYEEGVSAEWEFLDFTTNQKISPTAWEMPKSLTKVDISKS